MFDSIDHAALMDRLRRRISAKRVLSLVKAFPKAGVMTTSGDREQTLTGTPQGGILSPLLANIALTALDDHFVGQWRTAMSIWHQRNRRRRAGLGCWRLVRYADDFVVVVNGQREHAEAMHHEVAQVLAPLGLVLAADKTQVVHINEGFDFLGFHIRRMRKRGTNKHYVYRVASRKAVAAMRAKVSAATYRSTLHQDLDELLRRLNQMLVGWANYFRHGVSKKAFSALDSHAWRRVWRWLQRKHGRLSGKQVRHRFCDRGWRYAHHGVVFRGASSVAVTRYRYRGSRIPTPWIPNPAATCSGERSVTTCGELDAVRAAGPVRRAGTRKPAAARPATAPCPRPN